MMDAASLVRIAIDKVSIVNRLVVFSAPKYCDSTENKGAYINIGPEYKLEYHKFDAVPHPDIKPMVNGPLQHLFQGKLLTLTIGLCPEFAHVTNVNP